MKRLLFVLGVVLVLSWTCVAQTNADNSPATKEDVERYLQITGSHDMLKKMVAAMEQGQRQMVHDLYLKDKDNLPDDYESKMTAKMDEMFANMPWDEIVQAMVPVYQKHFTKGDIDNLVAFYSSPTGEKVLREMPSIVADAMQSITPIIRQQVETVKKRLQKETDDMIAQSKKQPHASAPATNN
jgi:uncharacterized protein